MKEYFQNERKTMVNSLINKGLLKNERIIEALLRVPREKFIPSPIRTYAYAETRLPIYGLGQAISSPRTVVLVTEALDPRPGERVLEVGTGSGYHAALISEIVRSGGAPGHVYSIEIVPELAEIARQNLTDAGYSDGVTVIQGDGFEGHIEKSPYDRIFSTAFAPKVPKPLVDQLKINGILVIMLQGLTALRKLETLCVVKKVDVSNIQIEYRRL